MLRLLLDSIDGNVLGSDVLHFLLDSLLQTQLLLHLLLDFS